MTVTIIEPVVAPTVTITPVEAGGQKPLTVLLGSSPAVATSDGGWVVVSRPKHLGFTSWEGYSPHQMNLNIMFDGVADGAIQEARYESLRRMMRTPVGLFKQPSPVKLSGPVPLTNLKWVIQNIDSDSTTVIRNGQGQLLRVSVTLLLLEYVEADVLKIVSSPAARHSASTVVIPTGGVVVVTPPPTSTPTTVSPGRTYTVKAGDTLWGIAQKMLGAGKRYTEIASLNGIRNPNSVPVGTVLKIP